MADAKAEILFCRHNHIKSVLADVNKKLITMRDNKELYDEILEKLILQAMFRVSSIHRLVVSWVQGFGWVGGLRSRPTLHLGIWAQKPKRFVNRKAPVYFCVLGIFCEKSNSEKMFAKGVIFE